MVDFLCLSATVVLYRELRGRGLAAKLLVAALLVGNAWQLIDTWRWSRQPLDKEAKGWDFALPFTQSTLDHRVPFAIVDWAREVRAEVARGKKVILVYNLSSFEENATDPAGIPERLYLSLGHQRFMQSVFLFGSQSGRWNEFPVRDMRDLEAFVRSIAEPAEFVGYLRTHPFDELRFQQEATTILERLARRWTLVWDPDRDLPHGRGQIRRFRLQAARMEQSRKEQ
jgi:hypothetical protein